MSDKSNNQGRAYEYVCLLTLFEEIGKIRPVQIRQNSSFLASKYAWDTLSSEMKNMYKISSYAAVNQIFELEPRITEIGEDVLELLLQVDSKGEEGDVRDLLIVRRNIQWEIGLSLKHNHFAVKHSRLSHTLDFGSKWCGIPCSSKYWEDVNPVFAYLVQEKNKKTQFDHLPDKENDIYRPLLKAFINEIKLQNETHPDIPIKLVEYLLGKYDFYKVISIDSRKITQIQSYNLHGTLNQDSKTHKASVEIPIATLPTRIICLDFAPNKANTVELFMDGGWQFSFRIHNAEKVAAPSLKFDIQIIGMPTTLVTINCIWK